MVVLTWIVVEGLPYRRGELGCFELVCFQRPCLLVRACASADNFALSELRHLARRLREGWRLLLLVIVAAELVYRLRYVRLPRLLVVRS